MNGRTKIDSRGAAVVAASVTPRFTGLRRAHRSFELRP